MIKMVNYEKQSIDQLLNRAQGEKANVTKSVSAMLDDIAKRGDEAILDYCEKFDGVRPTQLFVTEGEIESAYKAVDSSLLETMKKSADNIRRYHLQQKRTGFVDTSKAGVVTGQRILPIQRVGLYVPGGTARYPSSVLMNAIPAKIAGVSEIVIITPPDKSGNIPDSILAAAKIAGVEKIVKLGGAQAVAGLAYGTKTLPKMDKIVGPGNIYVATAKQLAQSRGLIDIDMIAGPSEILVIADESANYKHVTADLLSQAEHDTLACAWLITTDKELAEQVQLELELQLEKLPRKEIASASIRDFGRILIVDSLETAAKLSNEIAPEHLELAVADPFALLPLIQNAGSVFLGHNTPEPVGDYFAGPNHTLPTSGTARYSSPLGVDDFIKRSSFIYYSKSALEEVANDVMRFATAEGLHAHANAIAIRMKGAEE